jgi:hypothetical protein
VVRLELKIALSKDDSMKSRLLPGRIFRSKIRTLTDSGVRVFCKRASRVIARLIERLIVFFFHSSVIARSDGAGNIANLQMGRHLHGDCLVDGR